WPGESHCVYPVPVSQIWLPARSLSARSTSISFGFEEQLVTVNEAVTSRVEFATTPWLGKLAHALLPPPPVPPLADATGAAMLAAASAAVKLNRSFVFITTSVRMAEIALEDVVSAV